MKPKHREVLRDLSAKYDKNILEKFLFSKGIPKLNISVIDLLISARTVIDIALQRRKVEAGCFLSCQQFL